MDQELEQKLEQVKKHLTVSNVSRLTAKFVVRHSVGFIASSLAKTYVPTENKKQELQVVVGAYAIGQIAGDRASDWAEQEFDEIVGFFRKFKETDEDEKPEEPESVTPTE